MLIRMMTRGMLMMLQSCTGLLGRREPVRMRLTGMKRVPPSPCADLMPPGSRSRSSTETLVHTLGVCCERTAKGPVPTPHRKSARRYTSVEMGRSSCAVARTDMRLHRNRIVRRAPCCALDACSPRAHPQERPQTDGPIKPTANPNHAQRARCNARLTYGGGGGGGGGGRLVSRARTCCSAAMCDSGSVALVRSLLPLLLLRRAAASTRCSCPARCHLRRSARRYLCNRHKRLCVAWQRDARHAGLGDLPLLATL